MDSVGYISVAGLLLVVGYVFYRWPQEPEQTGRSTLWEGHTIEFIPVVSHRTFWLGTLNELWFDGLKVATSGGFCLSSTARATVEHNGETVGIEVRSTKGRNLHLNYQLLVNNQLVSSGLARMRFEL